MSGDQSTRVIGRLQPSPVSGEAPTEIPGYELLEVLGRGGAGVVWKARQVRLNRIVALKLLHVGASASPEERLRFQVEAEAVGRLDHPNIVRVHDVGDNAGRAYLALEYVAGGSLATRLAEGPLAPREAAALVETLALAMQYAHDRSLIHRDLKPANILLEVGSRTVGSRPEAGADNGPASESSADEAELLPKIVDFGLAKQLDADGDLTRTGYIMGTPSYMPPEQTRGQRDLGPSVDIYALGAVLYECLTGRPPFLAATPLETIHQVCEQDPVAPRILNPSLPIDLETICLKCLQKEPGRRYSSAGDLALDLRRFLEGEPVLARATGALERLWRRARRYPTATLAGVLTVVTLLLGSGGGAALWLYRNSEDARQREVGLRQEAENLRSEAEAARTDAETARTRLDRLLAVQIVQGGLREWQNNHVANARELLDATPADHRFWEWHYLHRMVRGGRAVGSVVGSVDHLGFTPDGRRLISSGAHNGVCLWEIHRGHESFYLEGTEPKSPANNGRPAFVAAAPRRFDLVPGQRELVSGGGEGPLCVFDLDTRKMVRTIGKGFLPKTCIAIDPTGTLVAYGAAGGNFLAPGVWLMRTDDQQQTEHLEWPGEMVTRVAFTPDGKYLATGSEGGNLRLWDLATRKSVRDWRVGTGRVVGLGFRPEADQLFAATESGHIRAYHYLLGSELLTLTLGTGSVRSMVLRPDGRSFAVGNNCGEIRTYSTGDGTMEFAYRAQGGRTASVTALAYSPDGKQLATACAAQVQLWDATRPQEHARTLLNVPVNHTLALDGRTGTLLVADSQGMLRSWSLTDGTALPSHPLGLLTPRRVTPAMHGDRVLVNSWGDLVVRDRATNQTVLNLKGLGDRIDCSTISADGQSVYATITSPTGISVRGWNVDARRELPSWSLDSPASAVALSPDGRLLAYWLDKGQLVVRARDDGREVFRYHGQEAPGELQFAPDGTALALMTHHGLRVWHSGNWKLRLVGRVNGPDMRLAFAPDGSRLVTVSEELKVWDIELGQEVLTLPGGINLAAIAFSADGGTLHGARWDGTVFSWNGTK